MIVHVEVEKSIRSVVVSNMIQKGIYKHFKGGDYEVIGDAKHSETMEKMVIYKALADGKLWVRPLKMFQENVVVDGNKVTRFRLKK